ncbi:cation transporter [Frisingicoccus sp.]|uniref:cation transporter n=1 Tax=Frisingicoccus sp. TaxID=1918627 RepID=UPI002EC29920|nr:cation transporter [Frisingicoccus sp.]
MKKKFKLQDLCCANCAAKMENGIQKIPGVQNANINFMMQKLTVEADDDKFDQVMEEVVKLCKKIEPDCTIVM